MVVAKFNLLFSFKVSIKVTCSISTHIWTNQCLISFILTCFLTLTLILYHPLSPSTTPRDCHGFTNPCGSKPQICADTGVGLDFTTWTKPIPMTQIWWILPRVHSNSQEPYHNVVYVIIFPSIFLSALSSPLLFILDSGTSTGLTIDQMVSLLPLTCHYHYSLTDRQWVMSYDLAAQPCHHCHPPAVSTHYSSFSVLAPRR